MTEYGAPTALRSATGLARGRRLLRNGDGAEGRVQSRDTLKTNARTLAAAAAAADNASAASQQARFGTIWHGLTRFGTVWDDLGTIWHDFHLPSLQHVAGWQARRMTGVRLIYLLAIIIQPRQHRKDSIISWCACPYYLLPSPQKKSMMMGEGRNRPGPSEPIPAAV